MEVFNRLAGKITKMSARRRRLFFKFAQFDTKAVTRLKLIGSGRKKFAIDGLGQI